MYQHILLPTDGSNLAQLAIRSGIGLAKLLGAKVTGLAIVVEPTVATGLGDGLVGREDAIRAAESHAAAVAKEARINDVPHECFFVRAPSIPEEIIKVATDRGCDLICMASHEHRGLMGLLQGSDTMDVLNRCRVPLLVYR